MRTRAVLLRLDGVIADTANVHIAAWERTFGRIGWEVSPEICARSAEVDDREFLRAIFAARSVEGDVDGWVARKQSLMVQMLRDWPRIYPGVPEFLAKVAGRARLAVISSTWRENVGAVVSRFGLRDVVEVIVAKEDLRDSKPGSGLYPVVLNRLGVDPSTALAFEATSAGLSAAMASGIPAVAVGHGRAPGSWANGATYVDSLAVARVD